MKKDTTLERKCRLINERIDLIEVIKTNKRQLKFAMAELSRVEEELLREYNGQMNLFETAQH